MEERNAYTGSLTPTDEPISIEYLTDSGRYTPAHWHEDLEMLYILNGTATVIADGIRHVLVPGECIVIDSNTVRDVAYDDLCAREARLSALARWRRAAVPDPLQPLGPCS